MQREVIIKPKGAGKTHLLIQRVNRILEEKKRTASRGRILILASSSCMLKDISFRLKSAFPEYLNDDTALEIHNVRSVCETVLRDSDPELQLLSDIKSWLILRNYIHSAPMKSSYRHIKEKSSFVCEVLELIQAAIINSIPIDQLPSVDQAEDKLEDIKNIYSYFRDFCQQRNVTPAFEVIPKASGLLSKYSQQFSNILIDQHEYFSSVEFQAIMSLTDDHQGVTIFREDQESISQEIPLTIAIEDTAIDEAEYIARIIGKFRGRKYSEFAILCRDLENSGSILRDTLKKYSIPCSGGMSLSQHPMVQFAMLSLQLLTEPQGDDIVLKWLYSPFACLDRADVYRAYMKARNKRQSLMQTITEEAGRDTSSVGNSFQKSGQRLKEVLAILDFIKNGYQNGKKVYELVEQIIIKSGFKPALLAEDSQAASIFIETIRDVEEVHNGTLEKFHQICSSFSKACGKTSLSEMLDDIREGLNRFSSPDQLICEDSDAVRIMSIWESKGLEFSFVFIPGMVGSFFPARHPARQLLYGTELGPIRAILRDVDLPGTITPDRWREQEKRLLHIAMTEAKENIYLTLARNYPENESCEPSPFLLDLLDGKELSADNCAQYGILFQDRIISDSSGKFPLPDEIMPDSDLEIACYKYIKEVEKIDHQKAKEFIDFLSGTGVLSNISPPAPMSEFPIPEGAIRDFTYMSLRSFLSCPRRYFLEHLIRVESDYGASAHFGGLVHKILAEFHTKYPDLHSHKLDKLWEEMRRILFDVWNGRTGDKGDRAINYEAEFSHNRLQARSLWKLAEVVLQTYLQAEHSRWEENRICTHTERSFHLSAFDKYIITGRIDRIDSSPFGHEIVDFKTSTYDDDSEAKLKSRFLNMDDDPDYKPQDYQLPIYYLAGSIDLGLNPDKLIIYQLRKISKPSNAPFRRELEILPDKDEKSSKEDKFITRADLESAKDDILQTLDRIASGLYPPEPREDRVCENECKFSFLCDREGDDNE